MTLRAKEKSRRFLHPYDRKRTPTKPPKKWGERNSTCFGVKFHPSETQLQGHLEGPITPFLTIVLGCPRKLVKGFVSGL